MFKPEMYSVMPLSLVFDMENSLKVKQGTPTDYELEELGCNITGSWKILGRLLDIPEAQLVAIERDYDELYRKGFHMLRQWKEGSGFAATYQALYDALKHKTVQRQDLAETFCCRNGFDNSERLMESTFKPEMSSVMPSSVVFDMVNSPKGFDNSERLMESTFKPEMYSVLPSSVVFDMVNSPKVKRGTPTDDELHELGWNIDESWKILGRLLDIHEARLEMIEQKRNRGFRMLKQWKEEKGFTATYQALYDALKHKTVQRQDLADTFCCSDAFGWNSFYKPETRLEEITDQKVMTEKRKRSRMHTEKLYDPPAERQHSVKGPKKVHWDHNVNPYKNVLMPGKSLSVIASPSDGLLHGRSIVKNRDSIKENHEDGNDVSLSIFAGSGRSLFDETSSLQRRRVEEIHEDGNPEWRQGELLGAGAFGKVFECIPNSPSMEFKDRRAVKIVKIEPQYTETKEVKAFRNEINILMNLRHERIVSFFGSEEKDGYLHLFMDFMAGGSLSDHIKNYKVLFESESRRYTKQILEGVNFLHAKNIIHRDIKGSNVLLDGEGNVKLADFGLSKIIQKIGSKTDLVSHCGTPHWMAPELIRGKGYGRKADIWSVGCTVVEMLTGRPPLGHLEPVAAIFQIGNNPTVPALPEDVSQDAKDFIQAALTPDPLERPWSEELLKHNFVVHSTDW